MLLFLLVLRDLSVGKVTAILFEVFELIRHGTEALLLEEVVWFEDLGLANEEVRTLYFLTSFHVSFKEFNKVSNELRA